MQSYLVGIVIKVKKKISREGKDREGRKEKGKIKTWSVIFRTNYLEGQCVFNICYILPCISKDFQFFVLYK